MLTYHRDKHIDETLTKLIYVTDKTLHTEANPGVDKANQQWRHRTTSKYEFCIIVL
jgi:HD superfamily phosphohydrolase YqeK